MFERFLQSFRLGPALPRHIGYDDARHILEERDAHRRLMLAARRDIAPEILYYLADDRSDLVRVRVAENPATPIAADLLLADDEAQSVRAAIAAKAAGYLGRNDPAAAEILERLADDDSARVRKALIGALGDHPDLSPRLARRLGLDANAA